MAITNMASGANKYLCTPDRPEAVRVPPLLTMLSHCICITQDDELTIILIILHKLTTHLQARYVLTFTVYIIYKLNILSDSELLKNSKLARG